MKKSILAALVVAFAFTSCVNHVQHLSSYTSLMRVGMHGVIYGLQDNESDKKHPATLFDAPDSVIQALGLEEGIESSIRTYLVREKTECVLIDAGLGEMGHGQLLSLLQTIELTPDTIHHILLTHMHGDHIGGLMHDGEPIFKHAELWLSADEYAYWYSDENPMQKAVLDAYSDRLHLIHEGDDLPLNIKAIAAPGHTPGHLAYQYGHIVIIGDAIHGWDLQKDHPEYCARFDMDKEQAIATRKYLLEYSRDSNLVVAGMHMPEAFFIY